MSTQASKEGGIAGDTAGRSLERLDEHCCDRVAVLGEHGIGGCDIVVDRDDPVVRDVHVPRRAERDHPAVVAAVEHEHLVAARVVDCKGKGHQVGLGARVREPDLLDRFETPDDQLGETHLVRVHRTECPATVDRRVRSSPHRLRRMTEQPGGVVAEQIDVAMTVDVDEMLRVRGRDPERERVEVQHRPGVATRQHLIGAPRPRRTRRVRVDVPLAGVVERCVQRFGSGDIERCHRRQAFVRRVPQ